MRTVRAPVSIALFLILAALLVACGDSGGSGDGSAYGGGETTTAQDAEREQGGAPEGARATECEPVPEHEITELRATGVDCDTATEVAVEWAGEETCRPPSGASRGSCRVQDMRCLSAATDRGLAASCAMPNRSVAFLFGAG